MKCNHTVWYQIYNNGRRVNLGWTEPKNLNELEGRIEVVICQGDIESQIRAENDPYYGGTNAVLLVNFVCNQCGGGYYPERNLPISYNINEWINNILKEIP